MSQLSLGAPDPGLPRTGAFSITMTPEELLGEAPEKVQSVIASDEQIVWEAYVPGSYSADAPAGVVVYVSPDRSGTIPTGWASVLDEHNLIWISANQSGNRVPGGRRMLKAIFGLEAIRRRYVIDDARIYIAGFSGGGKVASMIATDLPTIFVGGIFICGAVGWGPDDLRHIETIRSSRYVFLTGERDQALESTRRVYRSQRDAGVPNIRLVVVRRMGHNNPCRKEISKAIEFLESGENEPYGTDWSYPDRGSTTLRRVYILPVRSLLSQAGAPMNSSLRQLSPRRLESLVIRITREPE